MAADIHKLLDAMRANPMAGWRLSDVEAACRRHGVLCAPARGGSSHYKISHPGMRAKLSIPFARPIKPVYIKQLVEFIDAVEGLS
jgi:hypothetical protein